MPQRSLVIKNIPPRLTEIGKIKIGGKGEMRTSSGGKQFQLPQRHDHFTITTLEKGSDGNFCRNDKLHAILEKQFGKKPKRLPVRLVYDQLEMNFQSRYARYDGKTLICSGDGEFADERQQDNMFREVPCPCHRQEPTYQGRDKCKINGTLAVIIDGADVVGGVWKFRTTGYNSTIGIMSSLAMISRLTSGPIAGLPLLLTVAPKTTTTPDGKSTTVYVVGLTFRGTVENLLESSFKQAEMRHLHHARLQELETVDRRLLEDQSGNAWAEEEIEEFYPLESSETDQAPTQETQGRPEAASAKDINDRLRQEAANNGQHIPLIDSAGTAFDPKIHVVRDEKPVINQDGTFRRRPNRDRKSPPGQPSQETSQLSTPEPANGNTPTSELSPSQEAHPPPVEPSSAGQDDMPPDLFGEES